jgi:hypothetical protein
MEKGAIINRKGGRYEVLQAGLQYMAKNPKACIRPKDAGRCISLGDAIEQGLIRELTRTNVAFADSKPGQFPLTYGDEAPTDEGPKAKRVTEPVPTYSVAIQTTPDVKSVFYLPVSQLRAQVFLAHGLLFPAAYDNAGPSGINDAQAQVPDNLVLWKEQPPVSRSELAIAVRITEEEQADAEHQGDRLFFPAPLPISRVAQIVVPAESLADVDRYVRGWIEPDVPIPIGLFTSAKRVVEDSATARVALAPTKRSPARPDDEVRQAIAKYDRLLGLFAFMRNAARYHSSRLGIYVDYPSQFFHLVHRLSPGLDIRDVPKASVSPSLLALLENSTGSGGIGEQLQALLTTPGAYIDRKTAKPIADAILASSGRDSTLEKAFALLFNDDYKAAVSLLQKEPVSEEAVLLAALYKFSDRQSNDYRNIKQTLHDDWSNVSLVATILGTLGAYYGYTALDARESRLYSLDRRLTDRVDARPSIKFCLETLFERELIEAVYQHAFFHKALDSKSCAVFAPLNRTTAPRPPAPDPAYWKDESYRVCDLWVRVYRLTPLARCLQRIEELPWQTIDETTALGQCLLHACFFYAEDYELSKKQGKETLKYRISKRRLLDLLVEEKIRVSVKMMAAALDEDSASRK